MSPLKLISINVETDRHFDRLIPFLKKEDPDVICMQELMEHSIPGIESDLGMKSVSTAKSRRGEGEDLGTVTLSVGIEKIGVFAKVPLVASEVSYYVPPQSELPTFDFTSNETKYKTELHPVLSCLFQKNSQHFQVITTHFTWTPNGQPDEHQRADIKELIKILDGSGEFIFCGDLNAPRGGEIFNELSSRYKDNIPPEYITSLDPEFHRASKQGKLHEIQDKMVDGLFTTPGYVASNVRLVSGLSDHMAIVSEISVA